MDKQAIIESLRAFINQRPRLEFGNYGNASTYRAESLRITRQKHEALRLLAEVAWRDSITAADIILASKGAYSGRLTIESNGEIDYCTGQYWPTEYRAAVCAVLSSCLWKAWRDSIPITALCDSPDHAPGVKNVGNWIKRRASATLGRGIAQRWFA